MIRRSVTHSRSCIAYVNIHIYELDISSPTMTKKFVPSIATDYISGESLPLTEPKKPA